MRASRAPLYKPVAPRLVKETPKRPLYLGIHYKGFNDAEYISTARLPLNLIEVKPEYFKGVNRLFYQKGESFHVHKRNFERLVKQASRLGLAIQFHFPGTFNGISLDPGLTGNHGRVISLFEAIATAITDFGLLSNLTFHLPTLLWNNQTPAGENKMTVEEALANTSLLFAELAAKHASEGWPIELGVENQARPTKVTHALGYSITHFERTLRDTPGWINLTVDAGHRILSDLSVKDDLLPFAVRHKKRIINFHFHENQGEQTDTYHGDQHKLPQGDKIRGYLNYLRRAVQERIPVILEVDTKRYDPIHFLVVCTGIRALMDKMEAERLALGSE